MATSKHVEIAEFRKSQLNPVKVKQAVLALFTQHKVKKQSNPSLFEDVHNLKIQITTWKVSGAKKKLMKINLPHSVHGDDEIDICLISRDEPDKDSESTIEHFQDLLQEKDVCNVKEIIPLKDLIAEYKSFESRRRLARKYDVFLADRRIFHRISPHMGKEFYKRNKYPIRVDMSKSDLKKEFDDVIHSGHLNFSGKGCSNSMNVATTEQSVEDAVENVIAAVQGIALKIPSGWNNIKGLHLRVENSTTLPIHESLVFEDWWAENKIFKEDIHRMKRQLKMEKVNDEESEDEEVVSKKKPKKKLKTNKK
ncbi:ribosomal L1 domain-containing protein 1-like [Antedon mediterranea]|uniref:ribosomal L1 domain-containing protein 1-like n=1 Tax=Antedon mediterranea TaxID=105859 RepID=UPI003AF90B46